MASTFQTSAFLQELNALLGAVPETLRCQVLDDLRERRGGKLPLRLVLQLVLAMAVRPDHSIPSVLEELVEVVGEPRTWRGTLPQPSSITAARDRLGWKPVRALFRAHAEHSNQVFGDRRWRKLRVAALDGTTLRAPDTPENEAAFRRPAGRNGPAGFPVVRCLALVDVFNHQVRAATFGPYKGQGTGEISLAKTFLLEQTPAETVVLMDRGFCGYEWLHALVKRDIPFVVRLKTGKNTLTPIKREALHGTDDWLVDFPVPNSLRPKADAEALPLRRIKWKIPKRRSERQQPKKPRAKRVGVRRAKGKKAKKRARRTKVAKRPKLKPRSVLLLTNLVDAQAYPFDEIAKLYLRRWEVEFAFRELKNTLTNRKVEFRSKRPRRILQEAYALLLAYNAVRLRIAQAAGASNRDPIDLSFARCLQAIRRAYCTGADLPGLLKKLTGYVLVRRERRNYPRAVKCRSTRYPTKPSANAA